MSKKRPKIGVTGPDKGGFAAWWFTKWALRLQGAKAVRIQPKTGQADDIQGLIIGGGADINPQRYGASAMKELFTSSKETAESKSWGRKIVTAIFFPFIFFTRKLFSTKSHGVDDERDELEFGFLAKAVQNGWPVLGICRGAQLINVYFGGTLYSDIGSFYTEVPKVHSVWPEKDVEIEPDTKLFDIFNVSETSVNALHNQAVDVLGEGLTIAAREKNGIVQAVEHSNYGFLIGVQWHPEYMPQIPLQRRLFRELVQVAGDRRQ
ncbi:MAG TPA: gamma-glutamyl-gamma-aminobutyrate hydrolase family protein [Balneolaceae bacterium]|nr:gamma-glutamyl-gamma-aminobutyrate hydrolase family protein [Balneolaceae bacterium]